MPEATSDSDRAGVWAWDGTDMRTRSPDQIGKWAADQPFIQAYPGPDARRVPHGGVGCVLAVTRRAAP